MKNKETKILVSAAIIVIGVCMCSAIIVTGAVMLAGESVNQVAVLPSPTLAGLPSELPTKIIPTSPPAPTEPPAPVASPLPSNTPPPTLAPTPPPEPIPFTGQGDTILDVDLPGPGFVHIKGNPEARYFSVESYSAEGELVGLLVNTTESYEGRRPIDWYRTQKTVRFQVTAVGPWEITFYPLDPRYMHTLTVPGEFAGSGDDVLLLAGSKPDIATVSGNAAGRYFGITTYGGFPDIPVNTTDPYQGTFILSQDATMLEIQATGPWTIQISAK